MMFEEIKRQLSKIQKLILEQARLSQEQLQANSKERKRRCFPCDPTIPRKDG